MDSPVRKMLKRNDYNRHKLLRKIKRQRRAQIEQQKVAAEKELKRRLRVTPPKFGDGKEPTLLDADKVRMNEQGLFLDEAGNIVGDSVVLPEISVRPTTPQTNDGSYYQYWLMRQADRGGRNMSSSDREAYDRMMSRIANQNEVKNFTGFDGTIYNHGNGALEQVSPEFDALTLGRQFYTDGLFNVFRSVPKKLYKRPEMSVLGRLYTEFMPLQNAPAWEFLDMPGFLIKSLMRGSKLENLVSKTGAISLKAIQQWVSKPDVSSVDKEMLNAILKLHEGEPSVDYNMLRKEVLDMIPKYKRVPQALYANYGLDRIGYNRGGVLSLDSYTFESPGVAGNTKHYSGNPIGHSRTLTTIDDSDVLHVLESQSDWAQNEGWNDITKLSYGDVDPISVIKNYEKDIIENQSLLQKLEEHGIDHTGRRQRIKMLKDELSQFKSDLPWQLPQVAKHAGKNYELRQIQENLKFAAQRGLSRMRYPTSETAAKIEGYTKEPYIPEHKAQVSDAIYKKYDDLTSQLLKNEAPYWYLDEAKRDMFYDHLTSNNVTEEEYSKMYDLIQRSEQWEVSKPGLLYRNKLSDLEKNRLRELEELYEMRYAPQYLTILNKYSNFPKQFQKLFGKNSEVRTITDSKGNTWYEVDVPKLFRNWTAEMLFSNGKSPMFGIRNFIRKPTFNR